MARIGARDTVPEMIVRRGLHASGFRFRLHVRSLPGTPDLVLAKHKAVVFIHGCFWHGHDCPAFRLPTTRHEFWAGKIGGNKARDTANLAALRALGWRVAVVWECATRRKTLVERASVLDRLGQWLTGHGCFAEFRDGQGADH
jgi:DNA mismatch endonuclease, patch repair protein